jgi:hypothetical protein
LSPARVVVLHEHGHDPPGIVVEVYDHSEPSAGLQDVLPVEALTPRQRVILSVIGRLDRAEDQLEVIQQPAAPAQRKMLL